MNQQVYETTIKGTTMKIVTAIRLAVLTVFTAALLPLSAWATSNGPKINEREDKLAALKVLKKNAETAYCHTSFEDSQPLEAHLDKVYPTAENNENAAIYYILWYGDDYCFNTKTTLNGRWIVTMLMRFNAFDDRFFVKGHDIFKHSSDQSVTVDFQRLHKVEQHSPNKFTLTTNQSTWGHKGKKVNIYTEYILERKKQDSMWTQTSVKRFDTTEYQD